MGNYLVRWIVGEGYNKNNRTLLESVEYEVALRRAKQELELGDEEILLGVRVQVQEDKGFHKFARWTGTRIGGMIISVSGENALHIDNISQTGRQRSRR